MAELAQHRREHPPRAAAVVQADDRHALVEAAARRIGGPQVNLSETALGIRATDMDDGRLRQRQPVAVLGLDHCERPSLMVV
jgi:hypothetical protein